MITIEKRIDQELIKEMSDHLLTDEKPSNYIISLSRDSKYKDYPFTMLWRMMSTDQSKKYHPEGSVWNHSMLVLDEAAKVRDKSMNANAFMWAALLHDIGKPDTTRNRNGRITSYDHDKVGEKLCVEFLNALTDDKAFIDEVSSLVRYHMHILYVLKELPYSDVNNMLKRVDSNEIALLSLCDRMGRTGADREEEEAEYQKYLNKLKSMSDRKRY